MSSLSPYSFDRDPDTGLMIVRHNGVKIGQTQTPTGARLIARNHRRRTSAPAPVTFNTPDGPHVCPDPRFHKSECDH